MITIERGTIHGAEDGGGHLNISHGPLLELAFETIVIGTD